MEMSKEEFMMLHERLLDRLDRLEHKIESLSTIGGKQMLDMRLLLKVCDRTLLRWRRSRNLRGFRISGKVYYMAADVHRFLLSEYYRKEEQNRSRKNKNHFHEKEQ